MASSNEEYILNKIDSPADLRLLPSGKLNRYGAELRQYIGWCLVRNPWDILGASLGTVNLRWPYIMHLIPPQIAFYGMGHQAYGHKILTGRRDAFSIHLENIGRISGISKPNESEYDAFIARTCIQLSFLLHWGCRFCCPYKGEDCAACGGCDRDGLWRVDWLEALNNASTDPNNLLIVLNDNNMAIGTIVLAWRNIS